MNKVQLADGIDLIMMAHNEYEYALEEAEVVCVGDPDAPYSPGDRVLVEYSVFGKGKNKSMMMSDTTNFLLREGGYHYYSLQMRTLHADGSPKTSPECLASAYPFDPKKPIDLLAPEDGLIFIEPVTTGDWVKTAGGGIFYLQKEVQNQPIRAKVIASATRGLVADDYVWIMPGYAVRVKLTRGLSLYPGLKELDYVDERYVLAVETLEYAGSTGYQLTFSLP